MSGNGSILKYSLFGESHGPAIGVLIEGIPPGLPLTLSDFGADLGRRRAGSPGTTSRKEVDEPTILSGVYKDRCTGTPLCLIFLNADTRPEDYDKFTDIPRPGHADFTGKLRYGGYADPRGSGHFSGRLTLGMVAAGVIAKKLLPGVAFSALMTEAGGRADTEVSIKEASDTGDSVGAIVEVRISGMHAGIGDPFFGGVESELSRALFAVPGIRGVEFGDGFASARMRGSEHNDLFTTTDGKTASNGAGGINGGITNGGDIVVRAAVKPTSSIHKAQNTMNFRTGAREDLSSPGRHDACIAKRAAVVLEAVCALALADLSLASLASRPWPYTAGTINKEQS